MTNPTQSLKDIFEAGTGETESAVEISVEKTPSWFHQPELTSAGEAFNSRYAARKADQPLMVETPGVEKYEDFKRRMDDKFSQAQQLFDPAIVQPMDKRPTLPLSDIHGRRRLYQQEQEASEGSEKVRNARPLPLFKMLGLGFISLLIGGGAGLAVSERDNLSAEFSQKWMALRSSTASLIGLPSVKNAPNAVTVIPKKTVAIASLEVNDVRGNLNSMIPLMLNARLSDGAEPIDLKVMGLPPESYLTKGIETAKGTWLLKPEDLADVKLVVPQFDAAQFDVEIAAVEQKTGSLAAPMKAMTVEIADAKVIEAKADVGVALPPDIAATIAPATAAPELSQQSASIPAPIASNPAAAALISKGDGLLNSGDVASARQFYLRASELGDANGAYGVGRTYDPKIYADLNVQGLRPDPAKAKDWYKKAMAGGSMAAKLALDTLQAAN